MHVVVRSIGWILQAALVGGWLLISSLYFRGAWILGRLPYRDRDDPKDLHLGLHYDLVLPAVVVVFVATLLSWLFGVLFGVAFALAKRTPRNNQGLRIAWRLLCSGVLSVVSSYLFPFVAWWLDWPPGGTKCVDRMARRGGEAKYAGSSLSLGILDEKRGR